MAKYPPPPKKCNCFSVHEGTPVDVQCLSLGMFTLLKLYILGSQLSRCCSLNPLLCIWDQPHLETCTEATGLEVNWYRPRKVIHHSGTRSFPVIIWGEQVLNKTKGTKVYLCLPTCWINSIPGAKVLRKLGRKASDALA